MCLLYNPHQFLTIIGDFSTRDSLQLSLHLQISIVIQAANTWDGTDGVTKEANGSADNAVGRTPGLNQITHSVMQQEWKWQQPSQVLHHSTQIPNYWQTTDQFSWHLLKSSQSPMTKYHKSFRQINQSRAIYNKQLSDWAEQQLDTKDTDQQTLNGQDS